MQTNKQNFTLVHDIVSLAVSRPVAVTMVVIAVAIFGFVSYQRLPVNLMPEISYPTLTIRTEYPGSAPEEVEKNVTEKIEEALAAISNLVAYSSTSRSEISDVVLEFSWNTNMAVVIQEVREKLDRVGLPSEANRPLILRYDPSLDPIMRIGIYGDASLFTLRDISELEIKRALETIPGVASVKVKGGLEEEIRIDLEESKLSAFSVPISRVVQRIKEENLNTPCGSIREGERTYLVRTKNEFKTLDEMRHLPIVNKEGVNITLKELGRVHKTNREREIITRIGRNPSVEIEIFKEADANIVTVARAIKFKLFGPEDKSAFETTNNKGGQGRGNSMRSQGRKSRPTSGGGKGGKRGKRGQKQNGKQKKNEKNAAKQDNAADGEKDDKNGEKNADKDKKKDKDKKAQKDKKRQYGSKRGRSQPTVTWVVNELPKGVKLQILSDQSDFIRHAIDEVINTCITGGILAIIVLFLFLRRPGSTFIIAITIPVCVIATFAPLHLSKTSLNIMSLGGLALGIGMLVDNAIVVLESIVRHRNAGKKPKESAVIGTSEVGGAITASTLTTIAVFFPILYIEGIAGQIFQDQALTVVFSLIASLIMAIIVIPVLASRNFSDNLIEKKWRWRDYTAFNTINYVRENWQQAKWYSKGFMLFKNTVLFPVEIITKLCILTIHLCLISVYFVAMCVAIVFKFIMWPLTTIASFFRIGNVIYGRILRFAIYRPIIIALICTLLICGAVFCLINYVGAELVPELHQGEFSMHIALPVGAPLHKSNEIIRKYEYFLQKQENIKQVFSRVGAEKTTTSSDEEGQHTGVITCLLDTTKVPPLEEDNYLNNLRKRMPRDPEVKSIRFSRPTLFSFKTPIEIEIYGFDLQKLKSISEEAAEKMRSIKALYDVKVSVERGNPELHIYYKRDYLFKNNLTLSDVANLIRNKIQGENVGKFRIKQKEVPIIVSLRTKDRSQMKSLDNMTVSNDENRTYLREVSNIKEGTGPSEIRHIQQQRVILLTANIYGMDLQGAANEISNILDSMSWPDGYKFNVAGQSKEQEIAARSMQFALLLAAFLVYAIMASQFESLFQPLMIMFTLPLAFIGVIFALVLLNIPISIIVLIGIIILCGIVVNNAIVMIDFINQLREQGLSISEAAIEGAQTRLRPILMTTLTTLLGLLPMTGIFSASGGQGVEIRSPLAITVVSGLISSTLLTLVIIPVVYTWGEKLREKIKKG
ncbi:efflux RND transporter permease subunit [Candidatus Uabimicrobium amorphum]|uniref:Transporter n=1 Tax=Uabimicrobium amorphum TaxID=2596890 RepID=A0A5S9IP47_UABAM|nr:efflux RND transporter permease subunit [Candidatus Uabimicrobium amorphum]BBM84115.1 transporter [Candidatus Uabimicrobium amorphum]